MNMSKSIICLFNIQDVHTRFRTEAHQDVVGRFNERYINHIAQLIKHELSRLIKCCNKKKKGTVYSFLYERIGHDKQLPALDYANKISLILLYDNICIFILFDIVDFCFLWHRARTAWLLMTSSTFYLFLHTILTFNLYLLSLL